MKMIKIIAVFLGLIFLAGCSTSRTSSRNDNSSSAVSETTINVAQAAMNSGNPALASRIAKAILRSHPHDENALLMQARALFAMGRLEEAETYAETAVKNDQGNPQAHLMLGRCIDIKNPSQATKEYLTALHLDPHNVSAAIDLGVSLEQQGKSLRAYQTLSGVVASHSQNMTARLDLAMLETVSGLGGGVDAAYRLIEPMADASWSKRNSLVQNDFAFIKNIKSQKNRQAWSVPRPNYK